jgi:hypothetical protein
VLVFAVLAAGVLGACAQPGYDAPKIQSELRRAGLTKEQAACVTDGLESTFDVRQLASRSDPTDKEQEKTRAVLAQCGVNPPLR